MANGFKDTGGVKKTSMTLKTTRTGGVRYFMFQSEFIWAYKYIINTDDCQRLQGTNNFRRSKRKP